MKSLPLYLLTTLSVCIAQLACADEMTAADLIELDFEDLVNMNVEVESAGKNKARAIDLPYAVHVISSADIEHSGVQSVVEALRLAPGVSVSQISAAEWSVSIRGFGGRFSRFVLVMVDGRIAHNTAFSGVNWDELNIPLSEVDRIEIIRGPNAAAWGANAVNGIINIITRQPEKDPGTRVQIWAGEQGRRGQFFATNRNLGSNWFGNFYGQFVTWDGLQSEDLMYREAAHRDWRLASAFKRVGVGQQLSFQFDAFGIEQSPFWSWLDETRLDERIHAIEEFKTGWSAQIKYENAVSPNLHWKTRASIDGTDRDNEFFFWDSRNFQFDTELVGNWSAHTLAMGLNTRYSDSSIVSRAPFPQVLDPISSDVKHYGVYFSDVYQAHEDWVISLAARVDRSDLSNTNVQPSARILWTPVEQSRLWVAYSEATAAPSRAIHDINEVAYALIPASEPELPLPLVLVLEGHTGENKDVELQATELGYRYAFDHFSVDFSWFDFNYSGEVSVALVGDPEVVFRDLVTPLYLRQRGLFNNSLSMSSHGFEWSLRGKFHERWESQLNFSRVSIDRVGDNSSGVLGWLNTFGINERWNLSVNLRVAHGVENTESGFIRDGFDYGEVDDYKVLDLHLKWKFKENFALSLIANNLGESHGEAIREEFSSPVLQVEPYVLLKLSFKN